MNTATQIRLACLAWIAALAAPTAPAAAPAAPDPDVRRDPTVAAIEEALPSVVNIATETIIEYHDFYDDLLRDFYGAPRAPRQQRRKDLGSGVIIDEEGYILTNLHVVRRANRVQVKLSDGSEYDADPLVGNTYSDVALIKIRAPAGRKFKAIKLADDDDLLLGETVLALGNPFGLGGSVTRGILSSKTRRPPNEGEPLEVENWLQTDAAINPGNSGGPLINLRGELIGLNVAVYREGQGIGFAIPVKQVSEALARFFTPEATDGVWFGARVKTGSSPPVVDFVQHGSPADRAGLQANDRIVEVNGTPVAGLIQLSRQLAAAPDRKVRLVTERQGQRRTVAAQLVPFDELIRQKLGMTLLEVTPQTAARIGIKPGEGLFIDEVEKDGPADRAQLRRGQLLAGIDGAGAGEIRVVAEILAGKKRDDTVKLSVIVPRRIGANFMQYVQATAEVSVR